MLAHRTIQRSLDKLGRPSIRSGVVQILWVELLRELSIRPKAALASRFDVLTLHHDSVRSNVTSDLIQATKGTHPIGAVQWYEPSKPKSKTEEFTWKSRP